MTPAPAPLKTLRRWLPVRAPDAHKGDLGHALIVAGSRGMTGAAILAARGALRAGAGLVTVAVPESQQPVVAGQLPEALTLGLPETRSGTLSPESGGRLQAHFKLRRYTVLAIGPGISTHAETARAVIGIVGSLSVPAVLDADALNILAAHPRGSVRELLERRRAPCVVTPHPGEMGRLLRIKVSEVQEDRAAAAAKLAEELGVVCLLKGRGTIVTDGKKGALNTTGNPGLAKGGTGDALTGIIAGLWAQRLASVTDDSGYEAAALGAYLHGLAGDLAARGTGVHALLASDVIEALPAAFKKI